MQIETYIFQKKKLESPKPYLEFFESSESVVEIFAGLGGILGPSTGAYLFDSYGYSTPFYFSGGLQTLTLIGKNFLF